MTIPFLHRAEVTATTRQVRAADGTTQGPSTAGVKISAWLSTLSATKTDRPATKVHRGQIEDPRESRAISKRVYRCKYFVIADAIRDYRFSARLFPDQQINGRDRRRADQNARQIGRATISIAEQVADPAGERTGPAIPSMSMPRPFRPLRSAQ